MVNRDKDGNIIVYVDNDIESESVIESLRFALSELGISIDKFGKDEKGVFWQFKKMEAL